MKSIIIAIAALFGSVAFACTDGEKIRTWEPNSINDRGSWVWVTCKNGSFYPKSHTAVKSCKEGKTYVTTEVDANDHAINVTRVCTNGRLYPKSAPVRVTRCKEGSRTIFTEVDDNDHAHNVVKTCTNGKWR